MWTIKAEKDGEQQKENKFAFIFEWMDFAYQNNLPSPRLYDQYFKLTYLLALLAEAISSIYIHARRQSPFFFALNDNFLR